MSREALGIWRGSYEASVTAGRENRRAMLMVTREDSGLRWPTELDDSCRSAEARAKLAGMAGRISPRKMEHRLESPRAPSFGVLFAEYHDVIPS